MELLKFIIFSFLVLITSGKKPPLGKYNVDTSSITTSGISSGGAMAMQFHFVHSNKINGAGIFAGGPYLCADFAADAAVCMLTPSLIDVNKLITKATNLENKGKIDPTVNLRGDKVYIFHGASDIVVGPASGTKIKEMYAHYGAQIKTVFNINAGHCWPTENDGGPCPLTNPLTDFINKCAYAGSYEVLNWLYGGNLTKPVDHSQIIENLLDYDQSEFSSSFLANMDTDGFIYVPTACRNGAQCKLHVSFHGCLSSKDYVGNGYAVKTGLNDVAEANNIIILYPQTKIGITNPSACWDWFGYTGQNFGNRDGLQIQAAYKMMQRVTG